jgi:cellulose synthase/poly-beta-1,6-N-acetylglucosamine synthase-like glycosyltransferase
MLVALLTGVAVVLLVPTLTLLVEVLMAPRDTAPVSALPTDVPPLAVLIPAHNECAGIGDTLRHVKAQLCARDRLLVVADNCDDDTAAIAAAEGAEVVVRRDHLRRGKGYALDCGVRHLERTGAPEVVIVVDADCRLGPGCLLTLAGRVRAQRRPVQARYSMTVDDSAAVGARISALAWIVRNEVRPSGAARLGWPCQLMGSGMAFESKTLRDVPLASGNIVEDLLLGIELARRGNAPVFEPAAQVGSTFATTDQAHREQRRRWEHGHLDIIVRQGLPLLGHALAQRSTALAGLALDLCVPPLALLCLMLAALHGASWLLLWIDPRAALAVLLSGSALLTMLLAVYLAWHRFGRAVVSARQLLYAPMYALSKLGSYAQLALGHRSGWVRARREGE